METLCTLFTSPKPFVGHSAIIQHNALRNWKSLAPEIAVILMGNDAGVAEAAQKYGFTHVPSIQCSALGTPMLDDMFALAQSLANSPFVGYVNSDILFPASIISGIQSSAKFFKSFMLIGQRYDVDVATPFDPTSEWTRDRWDAELDQLRKSGKLHGPWGIDYFIFPTGSLTDMPPFIVGRPGWDTWLVWSRPSLGVHLINATEHTKVIHQNHDYLHVPKGNGVSYAGPEAENNMLWIRDNAPDLNTAFASTFRANYKLSGQKCCVDWSYSRMKWYIKFVLKQSCMQVLKKVFFK